MTLECLQFQDTQQEQVRPRAAVQDNSKVTFLIRPADKARLTRPGMKKLLPNSAGISIAVKPNSRDAP